MVLVFDYDVLWLPLKDFYRTLVGDSIFSFRKLIKMQTISIQTWGLNKTVGLKVISFIQYNFICRAILIDIIQKSECKCRSLMSKPGATVAG